MGPGLFPRATPCSSSSLLPQRGPSSSTYLNPTLACCCWSTRGRDRRDGLGLGASTPLCVAKSRWRSPHWVRELGMWRSGLTPACIPHAGPWALCGSPSG